MSFNLPPGVAIDESMCSGYESILSFEALKFIAKLHRAFDSRRRTLLKIRAERQARIDAGEMPDFLPETRLVREKEWIISPLPAVLRCRRVEIIGPVDARMMINALNSGADSYIADFEDSTSPAWDNLIQGQINLYKAVRRNLEFTDAAGQKYKMNEKNATLQICPRGWHQDEKHMRVDGAHVSGGIFDFGLAFFHNALEQVLRGTGPFYDLPKIESHLEARLWNDIFRASQDYIDLPRGTIKATVLIETILATFEMEEILYELRGHSAGLNAGRWNYIFSCIKKFKKKKDFCLPDRSAITMEVPFMRAYALALVQACHKRGAPAIAGVNALISVKGDPEINRKALDEVRCDKRRDAVDGYDGGEVTHPGLIDIAMEEFINVLGDLPNQVEKQIPGTFGSRDWLDFRFEQPITEAGLRNNINIGIHYIGAWLAGNQIEGAAIAEIARSQVWQWIISPGGVLKNGRKITAYMVQAFIDEELVNVKKTIAARGEDSAIYARAAEIFADISLAPDYPEFLALSLYELIDGNNIRLLQASDSHKKRPPEPSEIQDRTQNMPNVLYPEYARCSGMDRLRPMP